ncbi:hypothetical protein EG328_011214 [Venturia inaequalis]|uniref:Cutinase n=1 Tax=Venturia inaequalis TaxID=5025 RepID=A0A8H3UNT4_VENIN|nr:hypothetical protein EG327_008995 [Venturia inaequalis]KAE9982110.1 hypothetical protein EG328_011214 [Venturia inaequalis]RDI89878.1 hypothetical protein Vi05172_g839 [Venturia inaequalis]
MHYSSALFLVVGAGKVLAQAGGCSPLHFIYARAPTEQGYGAVGASIFSNVAKLIPGITGYPVSYPASSGGNQCASEDTGVSDMLKQIANKAIECPRQKFVLGGYSQGGIIAVRTINKMPVDLLPKIIAVTLVGSPECPASVKGRCKSFCNAGDAICSTGRAYTSACDGSRGAAKGFPRTSSPAKTEHKPTRREMAGMDTRSVEVGGNAEVAGFDLKSICDGPEPAEKGHKVLKDPHTAYSEDGYYVYAAACYIQKMFSGRR